MFDGVSKQLAGCVTNAPNFGARAFPPRGDGTITLGGA